MRLNKIKLVLNSCALLQQKCGRTSFKTLDGNDKCASKTCRALAYTRGLQMLSLLNYSPEEALDVLVLETNTCFLKMCLSLNLAS